MTALPPSLSLAPAARTASQQGPGVSENVCATPKMWIASIFRVAVLKLEKKKKKKEAFVLSNRESPVWFGRGSVLSDPGAP